MKLKFYSEESRCFADLIEYEEECKQFSPECGEINPNTSAVLYLDEIEKPIVFDSQYHALSVAYTLVNQNRNVELDMFDFDYDEDRPSKLIVKIRCYSFQK